MAIQQNHQGQACERQFVATAEDRGIGSGQRTMIKYRLRKRISRRGICRAVGASLTWLLHLMVAGVAAYPDDLHVRIPRHPTAVVRQRLEAEADEMWSVVKQKANRQWLWIATDAQTRQVMALHVGDRSRDRAKEFWAKSPLVHQEEAIFHTDQYDAYTGVIPAERHKAITKQARKTNHIERFNNTLRQRVPRLVRDTSAFSKKLATHIGAITYFICHYNLARAAAAAFPM